MTELTTEFVRQLGIMSSARASWDSYDRSSAQKAAGDKAEADALKRAREIWSENPESHDVLRSAFAAYGPLASMSEIERGAAQ